MIVVGQIPPSFGGQTIMIRRMLDLEIPAAEMHHEPMRFLRQMNEVGRFQSLETDRIAKDHHGDHRYASERALKVLYCSSAGPAPVPLLRELAILISTRWMFQRVVFHFHAAGFGRGSTMLRSLTQWEYGRPDLAIETARGAPQDGVAIRAKRSIVVWCGVEDAATEFSPRAV